VAYLEYGGLSLRAMSAPPPPPPHFTYPFVTQNVISLIQTCTPDGHLYRVTYTRCRIDTINSPDDGHMAARNMKRIEINVREKELCVKLVIYKDYTEMHGQQNIKLGM